MLLNWLPKYFHDRLGTSVTDTGFLLIVPYVVPFLASNASGAVADHLMGPRRGWRTAAARKALQAVAFLGPAACLLALAVGGGARGEATLTALSAGALGFGAFSHAAYWANLLDISPRHVGTLLGISNTWATCAGVFANLATGCLLETRASWGGAFAVAIGIYGVGLVVFTSFAKGHVVFE